MTGLRQSEGAGMPRSHGNWKMAAEGGKPPPTLVWPATLARVLYSVELTIALPPGRLATAASQ